MVVRIFLLIPLNLRMSIFTKSFLLEKEGAKGLITDSCNYILQP